MTEQLRLTGQPLAPPWRSEHRSETTTYRHYDDGRVSVVWHHRAESVGWREREIFGADKEDAERKWLAFRSEYADEQIARTKRRLNWGPRGGWQT